MKKALFLSLLLLASAAQPSNAATAVLSATKAHLSSQAAMYYTKALIGVASMCGFTYLVCKGFSIAYEHYRNKSNLEKAKEKLGSFFSEEPTWKDYAVTAFLFILSAFLSYKTVMSLRRECAVIWQASGRQNVDENEDSYDG